MVSGTFKIALKKPSQDTLLDTTLLDTTLLDTTLLDTDTFAGNPPGHPALPPGGTDASKNNLKSCLAAAPSTHQNQTGTLPARKGAPTHQKSISNAAPTPGPSASKIQFKYWPTAQPHRRIKNQSQNQPGRKALHTHQKSNSNAAPSAGTNEGFKINLSCCWTARPHIRIKKQG